MKALNDQNAAFDEDQPMVPSLPFAGASEWPPTAEDQKPFVHRYVEDEDMRLLVLLPHNGDVNAPLQCGVMHVKKEDPPEFKFVSNSSRFGNPWVTTSILVNGQSFKISNVVETFLRRIRDRSVPQNLFIWVLCADHEYAKLNTRPALDSYLRAKNYLEEKASEKLNVWSELEEISEEDMEKEVARTPESWFNAIKDCPEDYTPVHDPSIMEYNDEPVPGHKVFVPLDRVADEIRIFILEPHGGNLNAPVKGSLYHVPLGCYTQYEALTYTWGDPADIRTIYVSGQAFEVTSNLYDALKRIRDENKIRVLWIDAICINQEHIAEKNRQIQKMRKIYESATCVLMWLGEDADESEHIMDTLAYFHHTNQESVESEEHKMRRVNIEVGDLTDDERQMYRAIYRLLLRSYFIRVWCVQEQAFAKKIYVLCGEKAISWEVLHVFASTIAYHWQFFSWVDKKLSSTPHDEIFARDGADVRLLRMDTVRDIRQAIHMKKPPTLLALMLSCQITVCTNPRDKIYGYWGLASDAKKLIPTPDYGKSVKEIYTDFVFAWIREYKKLDIICAAHIPRGVDELPDMPTWCPDWSGSWSAHSFITLPPVPMGDTRRDDIEHNPLYHAAGSTLPSIATASFTGIEDFRAERTGMGAAGLICDTIAKVGSPVLHLPGTPPSDWEDMLEEYAQANGGGDDQLLKAQNKLLRVIIADRDPVGDVRNYTGSEEGGMRMLIPLLRDVGNVEKGQEVGLQLYVNHVNNILRGRRFFITKKGYFGLAHHYVPVGARVCVLFGCSVPVLLNRMHDGLFQFLGDCFVDGMMYGEMIEEAKKKTKVPDKLSEEEFFKLARILPHTLPDEDSVEPRVLTII